MRACVVVSCGAARNLWNKRKALVYCRSSHYKQKPQLKYSFQRKILFWWFNEIQEFERALLNSACQQINHSDLISSIEYNWLCTDYDYQIPTISSYLNLKSFFFCIIEWIVPNIFVFFVLTTIRKNHWFPFQFFFVLIIFPFTMVYCCTQMHRYNKNHTNFIRMQFYFQMQISLVLWYLNHVYHNGLNVCQIFFLCGKLHCVKMVGKIAHRVNMQRSAVAKNP